jgi:hypothetical protein
LAIAAQPTVADAYRVRGAAYRGLGEAANADADLTLARRLSGK